MPATNPGDLPIFAGRISHRALPHYSALAAEWGALLISQRFDGIEA